MLLTETLKNAAESAFQSFGDVTKPIKYHAVTGAAYQASTGVSGASTVTFDVDAIILSFRKSEIDGEQILLSDKQIIIPGAQLTGITPKVSDLLQVDSTVYAVVSIVTDPAEATFTFQVRER